MLPENGVAVIVQATANIALVKYWGKRNEELVIPMNDSISINIDKLWVETKVTVDPRLKRDSVLVNGQPLKGSFERFERVFREARKEISRKRDADGELKSKKWHIKIESQTNFPVAAGLASSAAGFAAIAVGLGHIFKLTKSDTIRLARIGSGSACRGVLAGFVHWKAGDKAEDDSECFCEEIAPPTHWPELRALILMVSEERKKVGSSEGMRRAVLTSGLLRQRVDECVPKRVGNLREAILTRNFSRLAEITMSESNQLHAICLDSFPPINYLNSTSHALIEFVHNFNEHFGETRLAYTFDAGPNCCLIFEKSTLPDLIAAFKKCFSFDCDFPEGMDDNSSNDNGCGENGAEKETNGGSEDNKTGSDCSTKELFPRTESPVRINLKRILFSTVGAEPRVLSEESLVEF